MLHVDFIKSGFGR